jgi:hypothetical protein
VDLITEYIQIITKGCKAIYIKHSSDNKFAYIKESEMEAIFGEYDKKFPHWKYCSVHEYTSYIAPLKYTRA